MKDSPDVIIVLSGGTVLYQDPKTGEKKYRSTTYNDHDSFGTLGGYARVEATAILAKKYPKASVITTSCRDVGEVTHAEIIARELEALGVNRSRIILEEQSTNTESQIKESFEIAKKKDWQNIMIVSNEYHLPRVQAFTKNIHHPNITAQYIGAEKILTEKDSNFEAQFALIKKTNAYQERLIFEASGVEMIQNHIYGKQPTKVEDKLERGI